MKLQWPIAGGSKTPPPLRPAGHSAAAEALVQPIIVLGSTILAVIACYVLAEPQIQALFAGDPSAQDILVIGLVAGLGIMVDTAMVLSGSRLRMHLARGRRDWPWALITGTMLALCLSVESMTLLYFGYLVAPNSVPVQVVDVVVGIHNVLFFIRNGMPPLVIAFFTTCLLPLTIEPADRDRATKASTSVTIAALQEDLVKVGPLATREEKIQALADQIALNEHASHATEEEKRRNAALIDQLRNQSGMVRGYDEGEIAHLAATIREDVMASVEQYLITHSEPQRIPNADGEHWTSQTREGGINPHLLEEQDSSEDEEELEEPLPLAVGANRQVTRQRNTAVTTVGAGSSSSAINRTRALPPAPGDKRFASWLYSQAKQLLRDGGQLTLLALANRAHCTVDEVQEAIQKLRAERIAKLRPGEDLSDDPVLSSPNL